MNTHPRIQAVNERHTVKIKTRRSFEALKNEAARLLQQAYEVAALGGLSATETQQALAANKIAGATFRPITLPVEPEDFQRLQDDLQHIARSVDGLIEAIGEDARVNTNAASTSEFRECFHRVLATAIDGNAMNLLEQCADVEREAVLSGAN